MNAAARASGVTVEAPQDDEDAARRTEKKAESARLTAELHRFLAELHPEKQLWRVFDGKRPAAAQFADSQNVLAQAWDPGCTTPLDEKVYTAVLELVDATDATAKAVWARLRGAQQAAKAAKKPVAANVVTPPARSANRATARTLGKVFNERAFLSSLDLLRERAGISLRTLHGELCERAGLALGQSTLADWLKASKIPTQLSEHLLGLLVTILLEHANSSTNVDYEGVVEPYVERYRLLLERRHKEAFADDVAARVLAWISARQCQLMSHPDRPAHPALAELEEVAEAIRQEYMTSHGDASTAEPLVVTSTQAAA